MRQYCLHVDSLSNHASGIQGRVDAPKVPMCVKACAVQASREAAQQAKHELASAQRECAQLRASLAEANDALQHCSAAHDADAGHLREALRQAEVSIEVSRAKAAAYDELNAEKKIVVGQLQAAEKAEAALPLLREEVRAARQEQQAR